MGEGEKAVMIKKILCNTPARNPRIFGGTHLSLGPAGHIINVTTEQKKKLPIW